MFKTTTIELSVHRTDDSPIFSESATRIRIDDLGAGYFLVLTQDTEEHGHQELHFDFEEFEQVYLAFQSLTQREQP